MKARFFTKALQSDLHQNIKCPKAFCFQGLSGTCKRGGIIPTRRIKSISKLFCLENIIRGGFV